MITIVDSIYIDRPPKEVYGWFDGFVSNYKSWHPEDHVLARWVKGAKFEPGSVLYAEEYLGSHLERLRFKVTQNLPNELIEYRVLFPESLICPGGGFRFEPKDGGCVFTAFLSFRLGWLIPKLMPSRLNALKTHMNEEGKNLKKLLEIRHFLGALNDAHTNFFQPRFVMFNRLLNARVINIMVLISLMEEKPKKYPEGHFVGMWMGMGTGIFSGLGILLAIITKNLGLNGIWPAMGVAFGVVTGQSVEAK
jgi:hypothetical protein